MINAINPYVFEIGEYGIKWYAVCILTGIILATLAAILEGKKLGIKQDVLLDGVLYCVPLSIIGARLYYVIFNFSSYDYNFLEMINIMAGGLAIHGAIFTAIIFSYFYTKKRKINIWSLFDLLAPGFLIGQILGRWGNFFNQEAHGGVTTYEFLKNKLHLPKFIVDQMQIGYEYYHPTFLYEACWNFVGLILIFILRRTKFIRNGDILGFYLIWYGFGRAVLIEPIRTDPLMIGNIRANVLISYGLVLFGIVYLYLKRKFFKLDYYHEIIALNAEK